MEFAVYIRFVLQCTMYPSPSFLGHKMFSAVSLIHAESAETYHFYTMILVAYIALHKSLTES